MKRDPINYFQVNSYNVDGPLQNRIYSHPTNKGCFHFKHMYMSVHAYAHSMPSSEIHGIKVLETQKFYSPSLRQSEVTDFLYSLQMLDSQESVVLLLKTKKIGFWGVTPCPNYYKTKKNLLTHHCIKEIELISDIPKNKIKIPFLFHFVITISKVIKL